MAGLQRLPQRFQRRTTELRQLVQEQHAVMGERHLSGRDIVAPSHQACVGNSVVRGTEWPLRHQAVSAFQQAAHGMDLAGFQGFFPVQRRQNGREPLSQHGLAGPRRTAEQDIVGARRRNLHGAARVSLPLDLVEIDIRFGNIPGPFAVP